jgi:hypothetical protein
MSQSDDSFRTFSWRVTAAHTIAYFLAGIFAVAAMGYHELFGVGELSFMRPTDSPWVAAGPGLQIIRGFCLSLIFYPFRSVFLHTKYGWGKFWLISFGLSYLFTFAAATGSFEGFLYTTLSVKTHLIGIPEVLLYLSLFTALLWGWYEKPKKAFTAISITLVVLITLMSTLGALSAAGVIEAGRGA